MSEKLKRCPFCGGEAKLRHYRLAHAVWCNTCRCGTADEGTPHKAIVAWNRRISNESTEH